MYMYTHAYIYIYIYTHTYMRFEFLKTDRITLCQGSAGRPLYYYLFDLCF